MEYLPSGKGPGEFIAGKAGPRHAQDATLQYLSGKEAIKSVSFGRVPAPAAPKDHVRIDQGGDAFKSSESGPRATKELLESLFHLPLSQAAQHLDLSETYMKTLCRAQGIQRWPFRKVSDSRTISADFR